MKGKQNEIIKKMTDRREVFMRKLEKPTNLGNIFNSMGIVINRISREEKPQNKIFPGSTRETVQESTVNRPRQPVRDIPSFEELKVRRGNKSSDALTQ